MISLTGQLVTDTSYCFPIRCRSFSLRFINAYLPSWENIQLLTTKSLPVQEEKKKSCRLALHGTNIYYYFRQSFNVVPVQESFLLSNRFLYCTVEMRCFLHLSVLGWFRTWMNAHLKFNFYLFIRQSSSFIFHQTIGRRGVGDTVWWRWGEKSIHCQ